MKLASDSAVRFDRYWVGPFEDAITELGIRAAHWEVEENDGAGDLFSGFVGVGDDGFPSLESGREFVFIDEAVACECCGGSGLRLGGKLRARPNRISRES